MVGEGLRHKSGMAGLHRTSSEDCCSDYGDQLYDIQINDSTPDWKLLTHSSIVQMMFVSGEEADPSVQTTTIIEEIVREQVVELVSPKALVCLVAVF